jgi:hypothetical protein
MSMTWLRAVDKIRSARNKAYGKPLQNNTRLYERGEGDEREFGVVLHGTEVVTIRPDDTYVLRAGGYHTVTTMDRIRGYSPAKLFSVKGEFYLWLKPVDRDPKPSRWEERNRVAFYDGITVDSDGYAPRLREKGPSPAKLRRHETAVAKMKKRIDKYVDGFIEALRKGMPMPSGADCWHCALHDSDGKTWGDMGNHSHLVSHMSERYYVPTLAVNALRERGYKDVGIYMLLDMDPVRPSHGEEPARMIGTGKMGKPEGNYDGVKRDLVKYMRKRLVPTAPTA